MTKSTMTVSRIVSKPRALLVAAAAALTFGVMSAGTAEAASGHQTRCVAHAVTIFGAKVPGTKGVEVRRNQRRACRAAIRECETRINRRANPLAECRVFKRVSVGNPRYVEKPKTRCVAKAFTRNGRELSNTRAAETRKRQRVACNVAINRCENKLDRKRWETGRRLPRARCEVVKTRKIYQQAAYR